MNEPMEHPVVAKALRGNVAALEFVRAIALVLHTWDDLVDKDSPVTDEDINRAFTIALVHLPRNAFYQAHFLDLNPLLMQAITNWRIATGIEREGPLWATSAAAAAYDRRLGCAFIIRSSYVDLLVMSATLIGGIDWGVEQGYAIREWAHEEGFDGFLKNLAAEKAARKEQ